MSVSIGGTITINIRDLDKIPNDEADARSFVTGALSEEIFSKIMGVKELVSSGVATVSTRNAVIELQDRDVSIGITITGTF